MWTLRERLGNAAQSVLKGRGLCVQRQICGPDNVTSRSARNTLL
ncbi:hypothetical protein AB7M49_005577 [Bradyrhizobium elkanii]